MILVFAIGTVAVVVQVVGLYVVLRRRRARKERYKRRRDILKRRHVSRDGTENVSLWGGFEDEEMMKYEEARFRLRGTPEAEGTISPYLPSISKGSHAQLGSSYYDSGSEIHKIRPGFWADEGRTFWDRRANGFYGGSTNPGRDTLYANRYGHLKGAKLSAIDLGGGFPEYGHAGDGWSAREGSTHSDMDLRFPLARPGGVYLTPDRVRNPFDSSSGMTLVMESGGTNWQEFTGNKDRSFSSFDMNRVRTVSLPFSPRDPRGRRQSQDVYGNQTRSLERAVTVASHDRRDYPNSDNDSLW